MSQLVQGSGSKSSLLSDPSGPYYDLRPDHAEILDVSPADQTVTVGCGCLIDDLQVELQARGQALPLPSPEWGPLLRGLPGTVGGLIAMNLPHAYAATCGGVKDWLLHAEVLFRGQRASSGAKVVKSVAGFDVHKLFVGSRGTLGPVLQVTLRTWPLRALPPVGAVQVKEWDGGPFWAVRTLRCDFRAYLSNVDPVLAYDLASCTLWADSEPPRPREGWVLGPSGQTWPGSGEPRLMARLKAVFDPEGEWR